MGLHKMRNPVFLYIFMTNDNCTSFITNAIRQANEKDTSCFNAERPIHLIPKWRPFNFGIRCIDSAPRFHADNTALSSFKQATSPVTKSTLLTQAAKDYYESLVPVIYLPTLAP